MINQENKMKKEISVYIKDCSLGKILVAETVWGICSILFGDNEYDMLAELSSIFPEDIITIKAGPSSNIVLDTIEKGTSTRDLRLDIRTGTNFQQLVWMNILKIPRGETMTYAELAEKVGSPKAWRAVASSCAKNVIAYVIPCHRVVSKTGDKMNYRWGADRKEKLLEREKCQTKQ
jgi:AraC family transcriptional regulator of adaptative response/methylated-DNA-[protein]-cysteine methyltransferase